MIKNIILDFDKDPEKVIDEDLYSYSGRKNIENVLAVEAIVNTTKLSLSALGDFFINLQKLRLDNSTITTVRDIGCTFRNLRYLSLNNCGITSLNGISTLSQNIEELYLQNNLIKDVSDLMGMEKLRILDLTNNKIVDAANLQFLSCCSNLKTLYFGGNPAVNNENFQSDLEKYAPQLNVILKPRQEKKENIPQKYTTIPISTNDQNSTDKNVQKVVSNRDSIQNKSDKPKQNKKPGENSTKIQDSNRSNDIQINNKKTQENNHKNDEKNHVKREKEVKNEFSFPIQKKEVAPLINDKKSSKHEKKNDMTDTNNDNIIPKDQKNNKNESQSIKNQKNIKQSMNEQKNELSDNNHKIIKKDDKKSNGKDFPDIDSRNKDKNKQNSEKTNSIDNINSIKNIKNDDKGNKIEKSDNHDNKKKKNDTKIDISNNQSEEKTNLDKQNDQTNRRKKDSHQTSTKENEIPIIEEKNDDKKEKKNENKRASEITEFEIIKTDHKKHKRHHSVNNNSKDDKSEENNHNDNQKDRKEEQLKEFIQNRIKRERIERHKNSSIEAQTENSEIDLNSRQPKPLKPNINSVPNKEDQDNNKPNARRRPDSNDMDKEMKILAEEKTDNSVKLKSDIIEKVEPRKNHSKRNSKEEAKIIQPYTEEKFILESNPSKHRSNTNPILSKEAKSSERSEPKKKIKYDIILDESKSNSINHNKISSELDKKNKSDQDRKSQKRDPISSPDSELLEILQKPNKDSTKKKRYENEPSSDHLFTQKQTTKSTDSQQNNFKPSPPSSPPQNNPEDGTSQINPARRPVIFGPTKIKNKTDPFSSTKSSKGPIENESENNFSHHHHRKSQETPEKRSDRQEQSKAKRIEEIFADEEQNFFEPKQKDQIRTRSSKTPSELAYKRSQKSSNHNYNNNSSFDNFIFHNNNNITADFQLYKPKGNKIDTFDFTGDFDLILDKNKNKETNSSRRQKSKNLKDIEIKRVKRSPSELSDSSHQKVESRDFDDKNLSEKKSTLPPIDSSLYPHSNSSTKGKKNSSQADLLLVEDNSDDGFSSSRRPGSKLSSSRLATVTPTTITTSNGAAQKYLPSPRSKIITRPL